MGDICSCDHSLSSTPIYTVPDAYKAFIVIINHSHELYSGSVVQDASGVAGGREAK